MNKVELIAAVSERTGLSRKDAERVVLATFDTISDELARGERVQIAGFGIFEVKEREGHLGRNPMTGERIQIATTRNPGFRAGKALKDRVAK